MFFSIISYSTKNPKSDLRVYKKFPGKNFGLESWEFSMGLVSICRVKRATKEFQIRIGIWDPKRTRGKIPGSKRGTVPFIFDSIMN